MPGKSHQMVGGDVVRSSESASMEVNRRLAERPLAQSFAWACDACAQVLAIQHPGDKVRTRGGEELPEEPKECKGTAEAPHGAWPLVKHDYHTVVINSKDEIVRGQAIG